MHSQQLGEVETKELREPKVLDYGDYDDYGISLENLS
jgi:hypothetical protein